MRIFLSLFLACCFLSQTVTASARRAAPGTLKVVRSQAIIFVDSDSPEDNRISREINHQLYLSPTLARKLEVTLIDINPSGFSQSGAARYLKDPTGVWVAKYRPITMPALFCQRGNRRQFYNLTSAEDIRKCL